MPTVVGVKLRFAPKPLLLDPKGSDVVPGQSVVVRTERGLELGQVIDVPHEVEPSRLPAPPRPIERVATDEDLATSRELAEKERDAMRVYRQLIEEHRLDMKPVDVEYLFGGDKAVFYFVAEERVDFRELVRELASRFKIRIDMRQVGVRDEARMVGGLGHCGQQLCCVRFGGEFQPVSIRMAKEQDLPLNPLKISGLCGRLMCCLRYEHEAYRDFKSRAPKRGAKLETPLGEGKVTGFNTPRETVNVRLAQGGSLTVPLTAIDCPGGGCPCRISAEALDALAPKTPSLAGTVGGPRDPRPADSGSRGDAP
ncbi:MAG TPA: stage 0 sporulation family protein, partial [Coriobacteriia bacterium]|nr:stage 0 sporulation family protein [Coriobacteriia bacterium]